MISPFNAHLNNKNITFIYWFYGAFLAFTLLLSTIIFLQIKDDFYRLQAHQSQMRITLDTKENLILELESVIGFGGFIHHFKNYLLRFEENYYHDALTNLSKSTEIYQQYINLQPSQLEKSALQTIKLTLEKYRHNLEVIAIYSNQSQSITIINLDTLVRVNDSPIINAISVLKRTMLNDTDHFVLLEQDKMSTLLNSISLLISIVLPLYIITLLLIYRLISFKTKQLADENAINCDLLEELNLVSSAFNTHEGIVITDVEQKIIKVNKAICQLTGYEESELIGFTPKKFQSGEHSAIFYAEFWKNIHLNDSWAGEVIDRRKNGTTFIVWLRVITIRNKQGGIENYLAYFTDMTDYKNTHAALNRRINMEKAVSEVAIIMLEAKSEDFDQAITHCLKLLGIELDADRAYLFSISYNSQIMTNTHEWCAVGIEPMFDSLQAMKIDNFSWLMSQLFSKKVVQIPSIDQLPIEACSEQEELKRQSIQSILLIPISDGNKLIGYYGFDRVKEERPWRTEDIPLFEMIANIFYIAQYRHQIEYLNLKHLKQSKQFLTENIALLKENRNLTQITIKKIEDERHFLAQELHDELGQQITAIQMDAAYLKTLPCAQNDTEMFKTLDSIENLTVKVIKNLRSTIQRIRSATLDHLGLIPALKELIDNWSIHNRLVTIETDFMDELNGLDENTTITLYRVLQEALTNISKHAQASKVEISLLQNQHILQLRIADNGVGINQLASTSLGFGLLGMRERIRALEGELQISNTHNSYGTCLEIVLPFNSAS